MATSLGPIFTRYLYSTWPVSTLAFARVLFGLTMTISCVRFLALGWVQAQYIAPKIHFPYLGFEWVTPLPEFGMYSVFAAMTIAAVCIMLGLFYRPASVVFFLAFTYVELLDKTYYLNHYYFVSVIAFLFCFLPAHCALSLDVQRRPALRLEVVPRWMVDILKFQIALVYIFAGVAKINADWLLHAMPLSIWLPAHDNLPLLGPLLTLPWIAYVFSWAGMLYDCTVPFFLMHRRTRVYAYVAVVAFHSITGMMFQIGVFPLVMIAMTLVFFVGNGEKSARMTFEGMRTRRVYRLAIVMAGLFVAVQILVPLRHVLYSGNVFWHEEGYRFSWRVMLMEKAGYATFFVRDGEQREGMVINADFLNTHQEKQMSMQPDMVLQFAHILRDHYVEQGMRNPHVRAEVWVTLNGRPSRLLVDQYVDLAQEHDGLHQYAWVRSYE